MKKLILIVCLFLSVVNKIYAQETDFPKLTGSYLGQSLPVDKAELFAPGIVSNGNNASSVAISPDGKEIYWDMDKIWFTKLENNTWTKPEIISFSKGNNYLYRVPCVSPDGKKLFFLSTQPGSVSQDKENIWYAEKSSTGWTEPKPIDSIVNKLRIHWNITVSNSGTLFFQGSRLDIPDMGGIYTARLEKGNYTEPVKMGPEINAAGTMTTCPHISPDESYIIFNRVGNSPENSGIFISYRDKLGGWLPAVMLIGGGEDKGGLSPRISPDGKYLFFVNSGMYWMPIADLIEELRPIK